jgi:hypothetical protein
VGSWPDSRVIGAVLGLIAVLAIAATAWIYGVGTANYGGLPIRGDGSGYYVYLPAALLAHDLTMSRTAARSFGGSPESIPGVRFARTSVPLGYPGQHAYLDQYGVGEAVLIAPFFAVGYALAVVGNAPRDGYSWPFQAAASAAGLVYMLIGLALLAALLRRWFSLRTVVVSLLALTFGAAVFEYGTNDATMSHAYSFFAIALVLHLTLRVWERPAPGGAVALGVALGLVGLIRMTNLTVVLFCLLFGVERRSDLKSRARTLLRRYGLVLAGVAAFLVVLSPQLAYWHRITGEWVTDPYRGAGEHLELLHPHLIGVLFSVRKGLFFWTPLLVLAVIGLPFLRRTARPLFVPAVVYLPVAIWVVSSWTIWWYGGSFGMRALIDEAPVFALGLAALVETVRGVVGRRVLMGAVALTTLLAVHGMLAYWVHAVPNDQTSLHRYLESFRSL